MQFLERDATAGELSFAGQVLMNGASNKEVRAILIGLDEYFRKAGGANERFVHQMCAGLLGRAPTPAETNAIIAVLAGNGLIGLLRTQAATLVQDTVEFEQRQVTAIYQKYLRRNPHTKLIRGWRLMAPGTPRGRGLRGWGWRLMAPGTPRGRGLRVWGWRLVAHGAPRGRGRAAPPLRNARASRRSDRASGGGRRRGESPASRAPT